MENTDKLIAALIKAQEEIAPIPPNAENPFLKSRYADLGAHIQGIMPALHKNGLTVTQLVVGADGEMGVETVLLHVSGQSVTSRVTMPVVDEKGKSGAQVAGSIISYLRRYALAAIVGAYSGDDNDGAVPAKKPVATPAKAQVAYSKEQIDSVLANTPAKDMAQASRFLSACNIPLTVTPKQIETFCKAYTAKLQDGLTKEDSVAEARKVIL